MKWFAPVYVTRYFKQYPAFIALLDPPCSMQIFRSESDFHAGKMPKYSKSLLNAICGYVMKDGDLWQLSLKVGISQFKIWSKFEEDLQYIYQAVNILGQQYNVKQQIQIADNSDQEEEKPQQLLNLENLENV